MSAQPGGGDLIEMIATALRRQIASSVLRHERAGLGVSVSDGQFLSLLHLHGPLAPGQLGQMSGLSTGTVTGVVDRLERAGYVHRDRDRVDRRKVIVSPDRERIESDFAPLYEPEAQHLAAILEHYSEDQLAVIADFLTRLLDKRTEGQDDPGQGSEDQPRRTSTASGDPVKAWGETITGAVNSSTNSVDDDRVALATALSELRACVGMEELDAALGSALAARDAANWTPGQTRAAWQMLP